MHTLSIKKYTLALFFSVICAPFLLGNSARAADPVFQDVASASPYYAGLRYLKEKGVVSGYSDGTFQPSQKVNRAEALKMLLVGLGVTMYPQNSSFSDVPSTAWYAPYVSQALKNGYVKGYSDGTFRPEQEVNRVESLKMLMEISEAIKKLTVENPLPIRVEESLWYAPYVHLALDKNLIDVFDESQIRPGDSVTRGDIAEMLYRYMSMSEQNRASFRDYKEGGISYYAENLEGNPTSSGEKYAPSLFTAAHREYPFGTMIQVVDKDVEHSALVRVNDRGPYHESLIADISSRAFKSFAALSKGRFDGRVYRAGTFSSQKKYISSSYFPGVTLKKEFPNMMQKKEYYALGGATSLSSVEFTLKLPNGVVQNYDATIQNGSFETLLYFPEAGEYQISLGGVSEKIMVTESLFSKPVKYLSGLHTELSVQFQNNKLLLDWQEPAGVNMYKIRMQQGEVSRTILVNNTSHIALDPGDVTGLSEGKWKIELFGAYTSTGFSHDKMTNWLSLTSLEKTFVTDFSTVFDTGALSLSTNMSGEYIQKGQYITFTGKALVDLKNIFFVLDASGNLRKQELVSGAGGVVKKGTVIALSYPIAEEGSYIFEMIRTDGHPVYLVRFMTSDVVVLPHSVEKFSMEDTASARELMLGWINEDRARAGLRTIELSEVLTSIATVRSEDMVTKNYFGHYAPDGSSVNDVKKNYNFYPAIAENLAYSTEGLLAAYLELRHSPSHLETILMPEAEIVGIGLSLKGPALYVVQEFSTKPLSSYSNTTLMNAWIQKANSTMGKQLVVSEKLSLAATEWAKLIAEKNTITFSVGNRKLLDELIAAGGNGSYVGNIVIADSVAGAETKVLEALKTASQDAEIGMGIIQDPRGPIKIVIGIKEF